MILLVLFLFLLINSNPLFAERCFNESGFFKPNDTYDINRKAILSSLPSNVTSNNNFYTTSLGQDPNKSYGLGMCLPGSKTEDCSDCIVAASNSLLHNCPNQIEAVNWRLGNTLCLVRYSNNSFNGLLNKEMVWAEFNTRDFQVNLTEFDNIWETLMLRVIKEVSSSSYYAAGTQNLGSISNMYSFVQCSKDLSLTNCTECLQQSVVEYRSCCRGLQGGIIGRTSCFMRWDLYPFLGLFDDMISPTSSPAKDGGKISTGAMVGVIVASIFVISVLFVLGFSFCLRRKGYKTFVIENGYFSVAKKSKQTYGATLRDDAGDDITTLSSLQLDFGAIEAATCSFERSNKLGQGGFGEVYKGTFPNGTEVAVKRLSKTSGQGEQEFKNEVLLVAKLQHRNLVRLLGFSVQGEEKILVYEFVPNKSLDYFLFDPAKKGQLDWTRRYKIINGIIRGILYLHQDSRLTIIHRDLKASNILLDADMNPKIADFGMARIVGMDQTETNTGRVVGTFGYMPPEYVVKGQFSMKSDVYSFGVLILEIIGGKRSSTFDQLDGSIGNLVTYVWMLWNNETLLEMVDSEIGENYDREEVIRCIHIGLLCVQENPADRPTMATIFQMFTNVYISLPKPKPPGFVLTVRSELNPSGKGLQTGQSGSKCSYYSVDNASITTVTPR